MKRFLAVILLLLCVTGCTAQPKSYTADFFAMDTFMSITAYGADEQAAQDTAVQCEQRVNALARRGPAGLVAALTRTLGAGILRLLKPRAQIG